MSVDYDVSGRDRWRCCYTDEAGRCSRTCSDGALFRVNPKGERGVFMCADHARQIEREDRPRER